MFIFTKLSTGFYYSAPFTSHISVSRFIHAPIAFHAQLQFFVHYVIFSFAPSFFYAQILCSPFCSSHFLLYLSASLPVGILFSVDFFVIFSGFHLFYHLLHLLNDRRSTREIVSLIPLLNPCLEELERRRHLTLNWPASLDLPRFLDRIFIFANDSFYRKNAFFVLALVLEAIKICKLQSAIHTVSEAT